MKKKKDKKEATNARVTKRPKSNAVAPARRKNVNLKKKKKVSSGVSSGIMPLLLFVFPWPCLPEGQCGRKKSAGQEGGWDEDRIGFAQEAGRTKEKEGRPAGGRGIGRASKQRQFARCSTTTTTEYCYCY